MLFLIVWFVVAVVVLVRARKVHRTEQDSHPSVQPHQFEEAKSKELSVTQIAVRGYVAISAVGILAVAANLTTILDIMNPVVLVGSIYLLVKFSKVRGFSRQLGIDWGRQAPQAGAVAHAQCTPPRWRMYPWMWVLLIVSALASLAAPTLGMFLSTTMDASPEPQLPGWLSQWWRSDTLRARRMQLIVAEAESLLSPSERKRYHELHHLQMEHGLLAQAQAAEYEDLKLLMVKYLPIPQAESLAAMRQSVRLYELTSQLGDTSIAVRMDAIREFWDLGPQAGEVADRVAGYLTHEEWRVRWYSATILAAMGKAASPAIPMLRTALSDTNEQVRDAAAGVLDGLGAGHTQE